MPERVLGELDALGRARGASPFGGGYDEKEQTLNQLLAELDGFDPQGGLVLLAATKNAAAVCGAADDLGTIEIGKLADLIVVGANPLEDINNVRQLELVLKEGRIVSDKREEAPS